MFAGCLGLGYAGLLGAAVAVIAVVAVAANAARFARVRRYIDEQARLRIKTRRELGRLKQLRACGAARLRQYGELRTLVDEVERIDAAEAERFDLQDLLDHYVRVAVSHQRCLESLRLAGADALPAATPIGEATKSRRRRDILQRRIRHRDQCARRMEKLIDELEGIDELVRLVAQRTACPSFDLELDREIDRRLWELDEVDAALHQLSA
ncbi:MAG TPA: hypothetical protein VLM79_25725 [Kofleriaceae bacterium]|nr:hypothetical protein [Kofleriaceae bacterium]